MITTSPTSVKVWRRGQLTIPKALREALHLEGDSHLSAFVVGSCLVLTPKRLLRASLARDIQRSMKAQGLTLEDLLEDLKKERRRYNKEAYGL